jgi:Regulator of chromosome condensation (RCC1) repeat/Ankyrin repeats (3 copies)
MPLKIQNSLKFNRESIFEFARRNDTEGIERLVSSGGAALDERDDNGLTAMHICATFGCAEACATLLKLGAKHSLQDYENGWTPLHRALYFGNLKVSLLLVRAGAALCEESTTNDWKTDIFPRRERWRSIRNLSAWKANVDHDGMSPLDLLSSSLSDGLAKSKKDLQCTSVLSFGKADFNLGVPLPNTGADIIRPKRIDTLSGESVVQVVASKYHSMALTKHGHVYGWGHGRSGRLGLGDEAARPEPVIISKLMDFKVCMIAAGENHSMVITSDGGVYSWGSDRFGQLGHGNQNPDSGKFLLYPKRIDFFKKSTVVAIAAGDTHSVCFTDYGELYSWGSNKEGQLGFPASEVGAGFGGVPGTATPKKVYIKGMRGASKVSQVQSQSGSRFAATVMSGPCPLLQVVASRYNTLVLCRPQSDDHLAHSSGHGGGPGHNTSYNVNEVYQWGHGSPNPVKVQFPRQGSTVSSLTSSGKGPRKVAADERFFGHTASAAVNVVQLSAGLYHNVALTTNGHVYTW